MRLINPTPFPSMTFNQWDEDENEQSIVIVKATIHRESHRWIWRHEQPSIVFRDSFEGSPATSALIEEQDLAPRKTSTDLTLRAIAHAPGGQAMTNWPVSVIIPTRMTYGFHVRGYTQWQRHWLRGWRLSRPEIVTTVPVKYNLAYGGSAENGDNILCIHEYNPSGRGYVTDRLLLSKGPIPAPQIGVLAELLRQDISAPLAVHGFGPIARTWKPRRGHAGTYDEAWQAERHPRLPLDFNLNYWNSAPAPLQLSPHLTGDEEILLHNLHPTKPDYQLKLPGIAPRGLLIPSNLAVDFTLDTVKLDVTSSRESEHTATLIWRTEFAASDSHEAFQIDMIKIDTSTKREAGYNE